MIKLTQKIAFKQTARLLIVASMLCVFFGSGVHIHAIFDHIFDHGDVHAFVHSHSGDRSQNHSHSEEFEDKDTHQHPTATVDLTGTLSQKTTNKSSTTTDSFSSPGILSSYSISHTPILFYLDLPPPVHLYLTSQFSFYSLRGPPLG